VLLLIVLTGTSCEVLTEPPLDAPYPSVIGDWHLTARFDGWTAQADSNGIRPSSRRRTEVSCSQDARFVVMDQRTNGALTWWLDRSTTCTPPTGDFDAKDHFADTWERAHWGWVQGDSVSVQTPYPWLTPDHYSCTYEGRIQGTPPERMAGGVTCAMDLACMSPCIVRYYQGTWEAKRP
jgi:hypothetical protein